MKICKCDAATWGVEVKNDICDEPIFLDAVCVICSHDIECHADSAKDHGSGENRHE